MEKGTREREINIWDMLWATCLKWRQIVVIGLLFAVIAGGFSYLQSFSASKNAKVEQSTDMSDYVLSDSDKQTIALYKQYKTSYDAQLDYNENSPLMKLDPSGFYKGEISFYIDNFYKAEYPIMEKTNNIEAIVYAYQMQIASEEFEKKVCEKLALSETEAKFCMDLIDCTNEYGNVEPIEAGTESGILSVAVYSDDREKCEQLQMLVQETIEAGEKNITAQFGVHDITLMTNMCTYASDMGMLNYQRQCRDVLLSFANNLNNAENKLSEEAVRYLNACEEATVEKDASAVIKASVNKVWVVIGLIGGLFLAFCIYAFAYIFSEKIKYEDDFEALYDTKLIGCVETKDVKAKGLLDSFFTRLRRINKHYFDEDNALDMIAANIKIACERSGQKKVLITGADCGKSEQTIFEKLQNILKNHDIELIMEKPILYDARALEHLSESKMVILMEKTGKTLYGEIVKEIDICRQQGVLLLGIVVVK